MRNKLEPIPWAKNAPRTWTPGQSFIGTGDIEGPPPPEPIAPRWYMIQKGIDASSEKDRSWLVEQLMLGTLRTKGQIKAAVARLGCSQEDIEALRWTPAIVARVREMIQARAVYATGEALPYQAELAKTDVASFTAIAKTAEMLKSTGIQINTVNDNRRNGGDDDGDRQFFEKFQKRSLRLVEAQVHDPEKEPIEPETTIVGADPVEEPAPEPPTEPAP